jgi:hypothetical protein
MQDDQEKTISRYLQTLKELKPLAIEGNDIEYANIIWQLATYQRVIVKDPEAALTYHQQVFNYDTNMVANYVGLVEANYQLRRFDQAFEHSKMLVKHQYPNQQKSLRMAIDCAMQSGNYNQALFYSTEYLKIWNDNDISSLRAQLLGSRQ